MEAKRTPGPWFAVDYAGSFCIQNGPMYEDTDILSYDSIWREDEVIQKEIVEANAKLICAAPEMLEALQILVGDIERHPNPFSTYEKIEIARKAIKKATE